MCKLKNYTFYASIICDGFDVIEKNSAKRFVHSYR